MDSMSKNGYSETHSVAQLDGFDNYPWVKDRQFLQGLAAMLGPLVPSTDMEKATALSLQARLWWFQSHLGLKIDLVTYFAHKSENPDPPAPDEAILAKIEDIQRRLGIAADQADVPSWQTYAPKANLGIKATDGDAGQGESSTAEGQDAPYPERFKAVIEAVTTGKPVPGVKEIPNTVVSQPGISPVGKMQQPKKPWEKQKGGDSQGPATAEQSGQRTEGEYSGLPFPGSLDLAFPPVENTEGGGEENKQGSNESARQARQA